MEEFWGYDANQETREIPFCKRKQANNDNDNEKSGEKINYLFYIHHKRPCMTSFPISPVTIRRHLHIYSTLQLDEDQLIRLTLRRGDFVANWMEFLISIIQPGFPKNHFCGSINCARRYLLGYLHEQMGQKSPCLNHVAWSKKFSGTSSPIIRPSVFLNRPRLPYSHTSTPQKVCEASRSSDPLPFWQHDNFSVPLTLIPWHSSHISLISQ